MATMFGRYVSIFVVLLTVKHSKSSLTVGNFVRGDLLESQDLVENKPVIRYPEAAEGQHYVVVMYDSDAKFVHMIVEHIEGSALKNGKSSGTVKMDYYPPSPPPGQTHDYWFYLYKQNSDTNLKNVPDHRSGFNLNDFENVNNLRRVADFFYKYKSRY